MNDLPGRGDVNPYGIPTPNPHEREGPDETDVPPCPTCGGALRAVERDGVTHFKPDLWWDTSPVAREYRQRLQAENERLRAAADELVEALAWYGDHLDGCRLYDPDHLVCDCGYADALARHREASGGE